MSIFHVSPDVREALIAYTEDQQIKRVDQIPDQAAALQTLFDAWLRLIELGWKDIIYCPKDGTVFEAIEAGSTNIHDCSYHGKWPHGTYLMYDADGDAGPGKPILFRPKAMQ